ncbi:hypothetical protein ABZ070_27295 [Streptomyces sp. NPDC006283]|uniref:hypothetical protein n=1 Tax=Streptomyces sp. NPDC006283 TaxID=3156741 RepID=UPI0033A5DCEB
MARHKKIREGSVLPTSRNAVASLTLGAALGVGVLGAAPASAVSIPKPLKELLKEGSKELCKEYCGDISEKILPPEAPVNQWANDSHKHWQEKAYAEFDAQAAKIPADTPDRANQLSKIAESTYSKYMGHWRKLDAVSLFEFSTPYRGEDGVAHTHVGEIQANAPDRERLGYGIEDFAENRRDAKNTLKSMQNGLLKRAGLPAVDNGSFWTPADRLRDTNSGRTYWEWVPTERASIFWGAVPVGAPSGGYQVSRFINSPGGAQDFLQQYRLGRLLASQPQTPEARQTVEHAANKYERTLNQLASQSPSAPFKDPAPGPQSHVSTTPLHLSGVPQSNGSEGKGGEHPAGTQGLHGQPQPSQGKEPLPTGQQGQGKQNGWSGSQVRKSREAGFAENTSSESQSIQSAGQPSLSTPPGSSGPGKPVHEKQQGADAVKPAQDQNPSQGHALTDHQQPPSHHSTSLSSGGLTPGEQGQGQKPPVTESAYPEQQSVAPPAAQQAQADTQAQAGLPAGASPVGDGGTSVAGGSASSGWWDQWRQQTFGVQPPAQLDPQVQPTVVQASDGQKNGQSADISQQSHGQQQAQGLPGAQPLTNSGQVDAGGGDPWGINNYSSNTGSTGDSGGGGEW